MWWIQVSSMVTICWLNLSRSSMCRICVSLGRRADPLVIWSFVVDSCMNTFLEDNKLCGKAPLCYSFNCQDHVKDLVNGLLCNDSDHRPSSLCHIRTLQPSCPSCCKKEEPSQVLPPFSCKPPGVSVLNWGSRWLHKGRCCPFFQRVQKLGTLNNLHNHLKS